MKDPVPLSQQQVVKLVRQELLRLQAEQARARARLEIASVHYYSMLTVRLAKVRSAQDWSDYQSRDRF